jgi:ATP-dependent Lon protease
MKQNILDVISDFNKSFFRNNETNKLKALIKNNESQKLYDKIKFYHDDEKGKYFIEAVNPNLNKIEIPAKIINENLEEIDNTVWAQLEVSQTYTKETEKYNYYATSLDILSISDSTSLQNKKSKINDDESSFKKAKEKFTNFWSELDLEDRADLLIRSIGIEPELLKLKDKYKKNVSDSSFRAKMLLLIRMIPFVEDNYNLIEIGERNIGKSTLPGLTSNARKFEASSVTFAELLGDKRYNRDTSAVRNIDVAYIDEITKGKLKEKDLFERLNSFLINGEYYIGRKGEEEAVYSQTSFVFCGNNDNFKDIATIVRMDKYNLFEFLPGKIKNNYTIQDRFHYYLPTWELEEFPDNISTKKIGLTNDFLFKLLNSLRDDDFNDVLSKNGIELISKNESGREIKAVEKTVSGLIKLLNLSEDFTRNELKMYLKYALEGRNRVFLQSNPIKDEIVYFDSKDKEKIHSTPLEIKVYETENLNSYNFESNELELIKEEKMLKFNKIFFKKILGKLDEDEYLILNSKKEYNTVAAVNNFILKIKKRGDEIFAEEYQGSNNLETSEATINLMKEIAIEVGISRSDKILDKYIKTYTFIRNELECFLQVKIPGFCKVFLAATQ